MAVAQLILLLAAAMIGIVSLAIVAVVVLAGRLARRTAAQGAAGAVAAPGPPWLRVCALVAGGIAVVGSLVAGVYVAILTLGTPGVEPMSSPETLWEPLLGPLQGHGGGPVAPLGTPDLIPLVVLGAGVVGVRRMKFNLRDWLREILFGESAPK